MFLQSIDPKLPLKPVQGRHALRSLLELNEFSFVPLRICGKVVILQAENQSYVFPSSRVIAGYDWFFVLCLYLVHAILYMFPLTGLSVFHQVGRAGPADMGEGRPLCAVGP